MARQFTLEDVTNVEDGSDELSYYQSLQRAINGGLWSLQGSYGRSMMDAINAGRCMLGEQRARDYWGSTIPARTDVQDGTKGSAGFVDAKCGAEWRAQMEAA